MDELIVIPARWESSRLPGKPLEVISGQSMIQRVLGIAADVVRHRPGASVVVATDDARIVDHVGLLGHRSILTSSTLTSGTERSFAAALAHSPTPSVVVNFQGDTPFTPPSLIIALLDAIAAGAHVATPLIQLDWHALDRLREQKLTSPFSGTTCVRHPDGTAIWFSKQIIPALRKEGEMRASSTLSPVLRHIGLYAYRLDALATFSAHPMSPYERFEELEQLRFIEAGIPIRTVDTAVHRHMMTGVDTLPDLERARKLIADYGEPNW